MMMGYFVKVLEVLKCWLQCILRLVLHHRNINFLNFNLHLLYHYIIIILSKGLPICAYTNDYLLCKRKNCKAKDVKQWFYLFIDKYNIENCYLKLTAPKLTEPYIS